ncbi:hypothetical protein OHA88_14115 [Streptomyces sp. NBC_00353]|uniref:hypothetical protein n=1 Tax=Streptomyces sp. NBC_00353 TaxID=2975722 RepID=UPI002E268093
MSGDRPDLEVPPEALALIAQGIDKAHGELKDLGMIGEALAGAVVRQVELRPVRRGGRARTAVVPLLSTTNSVSL